MNFSGSTSYRFTGQFILGNTLNVGEVGSAYTGTAHLNFSLDVKTVNLRSGTLGLDNSGTYLMFNDFNFYGGTLKLTEIRYLNNKPLSSLNFESGSAKQIVFGNGSHHVLDGENTAKHRINNNTTDALTLSTDGNTSVEFKNINGVDETLNGGGAIYSSGALTLDGKFKFENNSALNYGGAIASSGNFTLKMADNSGEALTLVSVGNTASGSGGFLYTEGNATFNIGANTNYVIGDLANQASVDSIAGNSSASTFIKSGAGKLVINSDASDWAGNLSVTGGVLEINRIFGTAAKTATVANGATLKGSGTINNATTIQKGGILAPGSSPGTLTFGSDLTLAGGAILNIEEGDRIAVAGTLTLLGGAAILINLSDFTTFVLDDYLLFEGMTLSFEGDINDHFVFNEEFTGLVTVRDNNIYISVSFIPEPSTYAAILGALTRALAVYRRRR